MSIAYLSDSLQISDSTLGHAVALGLASGSPVTGIHVGEPHGPLPRPEDLMRAWSREGPPLRHHWRVRAQNDDPVDALLDVLNELRPALVITGTHARSGLLRLLAGSVAESVARNLCVPTLILPDDGAGLVDMRSGALDVSTMLLPIGNAEAQFTVDAAAAFADLAGAQHSQMVLLHVMDEAPVPHPIIPARFTSLLRLSRGSIVAAAEACVSELDPRLIVMATRGHDSFGDVLHASHVERVLHACRRPLLWVPLPVPVVVAE